MPVAPTHPVRLQYIISLRYYAFTLLQKSSGMLRLMLGWFDLAEVANKLHSAAKNGHKLLALLHFHAMLQLLIYACQRFQ